MVSVLSWIPYGLGWLMVAGTLLSLSRNAHWMVRLWDFPRVQITLAAVAAAVAHVALHGYSDSWDWIFLIAIALCVGWQLFNIYPYTPLAGEQVALSSNGGDGASRIRVLIANVMMENRRHDLLIQLIQRADPDVILTVETDERWAGALDALNERYPYAVRHPQSNYYGIVLLSRLPLLEPRVEFVVQDDIPSVHTGIELPSGDVIYMHGLHPRPPEPIRDQDSTPRDAELVLLGRALGKEDERPTLVAGDLNDVAWSATTRLFLRLSRLLDPRVGRGFFNSYSAKSFFFRYPLDHIFHSRHFRLVRLERLTKVGSDHFPILVELSYEPEKAPEQQPEQPKSDDLGEASERVEAQAEAAATGDDRPSRE